MKTVSHHGEVLEYIEATLDGKLKAVHAATHPGAQLARAGADPPSLPVEKVDLLEQLESDAGDELDG
ncbi:MAG: hypothetical protein IPJ65_02175 [Archangiaceae bacterium]|nr:hypothetical protein [Archangiaceae bacterium]